RARASTRRSTTSSTTRSPLITSYWTIIHDGGQAGVLPPNSQWMAGGSDDLVHRVAKRIASVRRERGLSQENLAAILGIAVKNLQRIESGKQNLSLATLERICAAL